MDNEQKQVYVPPAMRNGGELVANSGTAERFNETYGTERRRESSENVFSKRTRDFSGMRGCQEVGGGMTASDAMIYPPNEAELFANVSAKVNYDVFEQLEQRVEFPEGIQATAPVDSWEALELTGILLTNIKRCGYERLTPVQQNAVPVVRAGLDALVLANTGSGKTASFAIPIINALVKSPPAVEGRVQAGTRPPASRPHAIVIVPTRELAIQTARCFYQLTFGTRLRVRVAYGGDSSRDQAIPFREGCDILIGCPGRLHDFLDRGMFVFTQIKYLVIDEMDRLFDIGFEEQIRALVQSMPKQRETLLFSATNPSSVQHFVESYTQTRVKISIGDPGVCEEIDQQVIFVNESSKREELKEQLHLHEGNKALVFTETKARAESLFRELTDAGFTVEQLHGDMTQAERTEAFSRVNNGLVDVLVTTDVAERGLDIRNIGLVINYDLPQSTENYVHRIGRTGRVGAKGTAISFVSKPYNFNTEELIRFIFEEIKKNGAEVPDDLEEFCCRGIRGADRSDRGDRDHNPRGRGQRGFSEYSRGRGEHDQDPPKEYRRETRDYKRASEYQPKQDATQDLDEIRHSPQKAQAAEHVISFETEDNANDDIDWANL